MHRFADFGEYLKALADTQLALVTVIIYRAAFHVVHYEEGEPFGGAAAIEELDNGGVVQAGESLTLVAETVEELVAIQSRLDDLDGNLFAVFIVGACREIDCGHATLSQSLDQFVGPQLAS